MTEPTHDSGQFFSATYASARNRLLTGARALRRRMPLLIDSRALTMRGPDDETLALDWLMFGARRPRRAFVLSSGTHGTEGFAGSAAQLALVQMLLPELRLPDDMSIVLLHAINPFGFAWGRRVNENNVDLNRNFVEPAVFEAADCPHGYQALFDALHPRDIAPQLDAPARQQLIDLWSSQGWRTFHQAVFGGQYRHAQGLQFGGHRREAGARHLLSLVREHLDSVEQLAWIDIHSGLGDFSACELITSARPDEPRYRHANLVWRDQVKSCSAGESVSAPLTGQLDQALALAVPAGAQFAFAFAEFGTFAPDVIFFALRDENWLYHHGEAESRRALASRAAMHELFCPADQLWRARFIATCNSHVLRALDALDQPFES